VVFFRRYSTGREPSLNAQEPGNLLTTLPIGILSLTNLRALVLAGNPLSPELSAAYKEGLDAVKRYLRAKAEAQVVLNEAKLILIGEGEVGKSCLLGALRGDPWEEGRPTTHGIEIKPVKVTEPADGTEITLNGWDFGGQRVYRPTHQLFFSAPAVYLVVWKPREGPQQGFVKEWIKLVKHREPDAKILVVATHGGPKERQPDIDRQEIWDLFGKETVIDFLSVESKPNEKGERPDIAKLKDAIARVAASLPEMGRSFPKHWQEVREKLCRSQEAYLPLDRVFALCKEHKIEEEDARLLLQICRRVGDLIHYEHDPALRDMVVLKPDWLATAMSFVLDDKQTREVGHGLVSFQRLGLLWNDPERPADSRYDASLHPLFLRLMERFDLSYKVAAPAEPEDALGFWQRVGRTLGIAKQAPTELHYTSLIAQLVPDVRPEVDLAREWPERVPEGDGQQVQICRIVETQSGQSATAEGLFFQLIVRLHKYSLGRVDYRQSVHWQRGLVLDDDYNGRALLEHIGNDVRITVRAPYPQAFLAVLTREAKWLVESFWKGMRCDVMVPCIEPCGRNAPGTGLYDVRNLIESKREEGATKFPCPVCNRWQNIDALLRNAPAARRDPVAELLAEFATVKAELTGARQQLVALRGEAMGRFDKLDIGTQEILSKVDDAFTGLMTAYTDEAKEGPRLFSFEPVDPGFLDRPRWISEKFRITLWCEHSRLPLPALNGKGDTRGVYELSVPRDWFVKAAPFLKLLTGTLSLVVPVASSATKLVLDDATYKGIEKQLDLGQKSLDSVLKGSEKAGAWLGRSDAPDLEHGEAIEAHGAVLRQLQAWLKEKDPGFGGLVRVLNKRQEFLWVHPQFEKEY
jgi:GTPase SAR1 family protein